MKIIPCFLSVFSTLALLSPASADVLVYYNFQDTTP
jgi:hypothetical protein